MGKFRAALDECELMEITKSACKTEGSLGLMRGKIRHWCGWTVGQNALLSLDWSIRPFPDHSQSA